MHVTYITNQKFDSIRISVLHDPTKIWKKSPMSQTMSTVSLNFLDNLEFKNNRTYMKCLVLLKNNLNDFWNFFLQFFIQIKKCINEILLMIIEWKFHRWYKNIYSFEKTKQNKKFAKKLIFDNNFINKWKIVCVLHTRLKKI